MRGGQAHDAAFKKRSKGVFAGVTASVDLHDQLALSTDEIGDVGSDRNLT
jgi:hypothetical protein